MKPNMIIVGMADLKVCKNPEILTTLGLGSCVGIALYDKINKVAGLAHAMLPDSASFTNNSNRMKFVDTSITDLIVKMCVQGAEKRNIKAKIAGGAQMFAHSSTNESMRIGDRNVEATVTILRKLGIPLLAKETGDTYGRTVELYSEDGRFVIKTISHGIKTI
ncbi:MAG: chemotaxis protein CheD [Defluviitaleaceae bacterium]|nr:chemotaxis protein CheD [Defluviitaleaceae bacterium]